MAETQENARRIAAEGFPCQGCGSQMTFEPESQSMCCIHCGNREPVPADMLESPEYLYDPQTDSYTAPDWEAVGTRTVRCQGCGAETVVPSSSMTVQCPFCGSEYVVDVGDIGAGILPETMMPFRVAEKTALDRFRAWAKKRFWAPRAFKKTAHKTGGMQGIYLPFWTYDADLYTSYTGQGGRDRTEVRTRRVNGKTETYTVTVTDWFPISGDDTLHFDDEAVCATRKVDLSQLRSLGAFSMKVLARYNPAYLAGFAAERYDVGVGEGFAEASPGMQNRMESHIRQSRCYDHYRSMRYDHRFSDVRFKHILLPVWLSSYTYRGKIYRFMVNGETGRVAGKAPVSPLKVLLACLLAAGAVALIALLVYFYGNS